MARTKDETGRDDTNLPDDASEDERREAGDRLRERIYATFTALAVLLALSTHEHTPEARDVLWTLVISVCGVLLAGLASDLVSHMIVHNTLPTAREFRHIVAVASRALGVLVLPVIMFGLAAFDVLASQTALTVSLIALILSLAIIVRVAVRKTGISGWKQVVVLGAIVVLGVGVVLLELLAH
jgi:hypothetical protein